MKAGFEEKVLICYDIAWVMRCGAWHINQARLVWLVCHVSHLVFSCKKISAVVIVPLVNFPFLITFCVLTSLVSRFECMFVKCTLSCVGGKINIILATNKIEYYNN